MNYLNFKKIFILYLSFLFITAIYYLYKKHLGGLDSTISEWMINYYGGFTRRGLTGFIFVNISELFNVNLRFVIFTFQVFFYGSFLLLVYYYFRNIYNSFVFYLCLFCPLFLLYHLAELEILARKELIIFIHYFIYLIFNEKENLNKFADIYLIFTFPIVILIWEPVVFFIPFYFLIYSVKYNNKILKEFPKNIFLVFSTSFITTLILIFNEYSIVNEKIMCEKLKTNFNENCYMSLRYLDTSIKENFHSLFSDIKFIYVFRYLLIFIIGFAPLIYLMYFMKKKTYNKNILFTLSYFKIFILISSPVLILFLMGLDWGRWINILYFYSFTSLYYLLKNNFYYIELKKIKKIRFNRIENNKFILVLIFVIFCFSWNPKTLYKGDVASFPGYRVPYNLIKNLLNDF